ALGERAADLELGAQPLAEAAVELEQERVAVLHGGGVVLLAVEARLARGQARAAGGAEHAGACSGSHRLEQRSSRRRVEERIHEEALISENCDHARRGRGLLAGLERKREHESLRFAMSEVDGD